MTDKEKVIVEGIRDWYNSRTDYIKPEWYGAIGDGVVDDTTAINKAIKAASKNGAYVKFSPKTYKITKLNLKNNSMLIGNNTIFKSYEENDINNHASDFNEVKQLNNILIKGITFHDTFILKFQLCSDITIEDCTFEYARLYSLFFQWCKENITIRNNKFDDIGRMISSEYPKYVKKNGNGFLITNIETSGYTACRVENDEDGTHTIDYGLGAVNQIAIIGAYSEDKKKELGINVTGISGNYGRAIIVQGQSKDVETKNEYHTHNVLITGNEFTATYGIKAVTFLNKVSGIEVSNNYAHDLTYGFIEFYGHYSDENATSICCDNRCINIGTHDPAPNDLVGWDEQTKIGSGVGSSCFFMDSAGRTNGWYNFNVIVTRNFIKNCGENAIEGKYKEISYNTIDTTGVCAQLRYIPVDSEAGEDIDILDKITKKYRFTPSYEGIYVSGTDMNIHHNVIKNVPVRGINCYLANGTSFNNLYIENNTFENTGYDVDRVYYNDPKYGYEQKRSGDVNSDCTEIHVQTVNNGRMKNLVIQNNAITMSPVIVIADNQNAIQKLIYTQDIMFRTNTSVRIKTPIINVNGQLTDDSWYTVKDSDKKEVIADTSAPIKLGIYTCLKQKVCRNMIKNPNTDYVFVIFKATYKYYSYNNNNGNRAIGVQFRISGNSNKGYNSWDIPYNASTEIPEEPPTTTQYIVCPLKTTAEDVDVELYFNNNNGRVEITDIQALVI